MTHEGSSGGGGVLAGKVPGWLGGPKSLPVDPNAPLTPAEARHLIDHVNVNHDIQTAFASTPPPDEKSLAFWKKFFDGMGHFFDGVGKLFAPLGPAMPYIVFLLAAAVVGALLSPVVRAMIATRFERLFQRHNLRADEEWRPTREAVIALLADIDGLAAKGQWDEAVHLLLQRSVADINAFRPSLVKSHFSARDIASHPLLPERARPAFREIVRWSEQSYFAGIPVGREGFDACRAAYVTFVASEGIG